MPSSRPPARPPAKGQKATRPPARKKIPINTLETALEDAYGIVTDAAHAVGMGRQALHRRIARSSRLRAAVTAGRERLLDKGETKLVTAVDKGEAWAITLLLKTLGKSRGYVERQELDAIFAMLEKDPADMTDAELDEALARVTSRRRG